VGLPINGMQLPSVCDPHNELTSSEGTTYAAVVASSIAQRHQRARLLTNWCPLKIPSYSRSVLRFGPFQVDLASGELHKHGVRLRLQEQPFQILVMLLENPGEVVTRDELRNKLWSADTFVDFDVGLNNAVLRLRNVLGDSADSPRFIETLPRRGYRFIAPVDAPVPAQVPNNAQPPTAGYQREAVASPAAATTQVAKPRPEWLRARRIWSVGFVLALLLVLFAALNVGRLRQRILGRPVAPAIRSLAVLPLENLSGDEAQEYFADGMTDELITDLASIASLRVISRTSTTHYKGTRKTIPEIARELNVDAVVEGSVGRSANKVRIRAQLVRAAPEEHLWAKSYERDLPDVLALQRDVANAIANEIKIHLTPQERQHLANARSINPDAYNAFLLGDYHSSKRNPAALDKGIQYFQEAIRIDPSYAQAYAGLAEAFIERDIWGGLGVGKSADQVRAATLKALELDAQLAEAHALLAHIHFQYDWDWQGTEAEYKRAVELNPNLAGSYVGYAYFLQAMGRHQEALASVRRAVELDPLSASNITDEGRILYRARQYESAIARYQRALELDPGYLPALSRIAEAYEEWGKYDQALAAVQKFQQAAADPRDIRRPLGRLYARTGRRREALEITRAIEADPNTSGSAFALAVIYSALGDRDRAIAALEKGAQTRSLLPFVFTDPQLDPVRSDPRFQQLLRRAGLPS
jgi:TolB-like protein/DNA-binding winged helix-turn-helix (wHTH) protein/Tfp pilus assembly protein PilF